MHGPLLQSPIGCITTYVVPKTGYCTVRQALTSQEQVQVQTQHLTNPSAVCAPAFVKLDHAC
jgi:hypothetical protein